MSPTYKTLYRSLPCDRPTKMGPARAHFGDEHIYFDQGRGKAEYENVAGTVRKISLRQNDRCASSA